MKIVALVYGFIWLAVFAYLFLMGRRLARLHAEMDELHSRLESRSGRPKNRG
ncbi:MAG: CcmD family protein [Polyangia bacterium]|jgi:CcmD family protein